MSQPVTKLRVVTPSVDEKPSPKLRYGFEELIVTCRDYSPLLKQCVKEVGPPRAKCPLDFDWRQAFQANAAGLLLVLAARVDDDDIVWSASASMSSAGRSSIPPRCMHRST